MKTESNSTNRTAYHALMHFEIYGSKPTDAALDAMKAECKRLSKCFGDSDVKQHARYAAALRKLVPKMSRVGE